MSIPQAIIDDFYGLKKFPYSDLSEEELRDMEEWRSQVVDLLSTVTATADTWNIILPVLGYDLEEAKEIVSSKSDKEQLPSALQSCFTLKQLTNLIGNDVRLY